MRVVKVLNNSLIMALDEDGQEVILSGKGIGYRKAIGYELKENEIQKIFVLRERTVVRDVIRLAAEMGEEYFNLTKSVISYAVETYHMKLMDHIYLALTDHLAFTEKRLRQNVVIENFYTADLRRFNPEEYDVACYGARLFEEKFGMKLPEGEIGNIAFHFINAQQDGQFEERNREIDEVVGQILNIVRYCMKISSLEEGIAYSRMLTHLRLFVSRLLRGQMTDDDQEDALRWKILEMCPEEYACVRRIGRFIEQKYGEPITGQEELYLTIHLHQLMTEKKKEVK